MQLLLLALAPVAAILIYVYYRDSVEKEPAGILTLSFLTGACAVVPILIVELALAAAGHVAGPGSELGEAFYDSFIVAAATEESFKFLALLIITWRSSHFDYKFDGIVYAVFVSLGFAAAENIVYVFRHGTEVGLLRAFTAVPSHAVDGVAMGYYYSLAKFSPDKGPQFMALALGLPILLHGFYDFCVLSQNSFLLVLFMPFFLLSIRLAFAQMRTHSAADASIEAPPIIIPLTPQSSNPTITELDQRLQVLTRLRDEGTITPDEFEQRKQDLLQRLTS